MHSTLGLPGAGEKKGWEGTEMLLKELKIFTETVTVDGGKVRESGETDMLCCNDVGRTGSMALYAIRSCAPCRSYTEWR